MLEESWELNALYSSGSLLHGLQPATVLSAPWKAAYLKEYRLEAIGSDHYHSISTGQTPPKDIQIAFVSHLPFTRELVTVLSKTGLCGMRGGKEGTNTSVCAHPQPENSEWARGRRLAQGQADSDWVSLWSLPVHSQSRHDYVSVGLLCKVSCLYPGRSHCGG